MDDALTEWAASAGESDPTSAHVVLAGGTALDLPEVTPSLADTDPTYYLDQIAARLLAIEARKTETEALFAALFADHDIGDFYAYWLINAAQAEISAGTLAALAADARVSRIEAVSEPEDESSNNGDAIMDATGLIDYLDAGLDGELPSGRSSVNDMYVGILDNYFFQGHPAWEDCGSSAECLADCGSSTCPDRLVNTWKWDAIIGAWVPDYTTPSDAHGTHVASMLVADLTDDQDPAYQDPGLGGSALGAVVAILLALVAIALTCSRFSDPVRQDGLPPRERSGADDYSHQVRSYRVAGQQQEWTRQEVLRELSHSDSIVVALRRNGVEDIGAELRRRLAEVRPTEPEMEAVLAADRLNIGQNRASDPSLRPFWPQTGWISDKTEPVTPH